MDRTPFVWVTLPIGLLDRPRSEVEALGLPVQWLVAALVAAASEG